MPDLPFLGKASLRDLEGALDAKLLAGGRCRGLHYGSNDAFLVTTGLRRFLRRAFEQRAENWTRPLVVTHATRDDLLLGCAGTCLIRHPRLLAATRLRGLGPCEACLARH